MWNFLFAESLPFPHLKKMWQYLSLKPIKLVGPKIHNIKVEYQRIRHEGAQYK